MLVMAAARLTTYEARGVVVSHCLGVTEGLQNGVGLHDLVFEVTLKVLDGEGVKCIPEPTELFSQR